MTADILKAVRNYRLYEKLDNGEFVEVSENAIGWLVNDLKGKMLPRWIKVSERLPNEEKVGYNFHVKASSQNAGYAWNDTAIYRGPGKWEFLHNKGQFVVEWLESLQATTPQTAEGELLDALKGCVLALNDADIFPETTERAMAVIRKVEGKATPQTVEAPKEFIERHLEKIRQLTEEGLQKQWTKELMELFNDSLCAEDEQESGLEAHGITVGGKEETVFVIIRDFLLPLWRKYKAEQRSQERQKAITSNNKQ